MKPQLNVSFICYSMFSQLQNVLNALGLFFLAIAVYPEIHIIVYITTVTYWFFCKKWGKSHENWMIRNWNGSIIQLGTKNTFPSLKSWFFTWQNPQNEHRFNVILSSICGTASMQSQINNFHRLENPQHPEAGSYILHFTILKNKHIRCAFNF